MFKKNKGCNNILEVRFDMFDTYTYGFIYHHELSILNDIVNI